MSSQPHVVLEMVEVVTDQLGDDAILFCHLLLHLHHLRPGRAELLLQGLDLTELFSLHDHHIVRVVYCVLSLQCDQSKTKPDLRLDLTVN